MGQTVVNGIVVSTMAALENNNSRVPSRSFRISLLLPIFFAAVSGNAFGQSCPHPNYPTGTPTAIDSRCGPQGSGGDEATQNEAKNNFCASGAKLMTVAAMVSLQAQVEKDKSIPFGNAELHPLTSTPGPAKDRKPLQALGEGDEVVLTGFVKISRQEGAESVNCGNDVPNNPADHDIHISIVANPNDQECTGIVVEMIPHHRPASWTPDLVSAAGTARLPVRVTGQLMFDSSHTPCVNGKPVTTTSASDPARASLWEVHPIYKFEVCQQGNCSSGSGWVPIEDWKQ